MTVETQILKDIQQQINIQSEKIKKIENQFTSQIKNIKNQFTSLHDRQKLLEAQLIKQGRLYSFSFMADRTIPVVLEI